MNIEEYLANFNRGDKKLSLDTMKYFMNHFGNPERKLKIIHVAGTNGKGSFCEMMSKILIKSGYKVGKFIGPHLIKYNERISIDNKNISDDELEKIVLELNQLIEEYNSKFEMKVTYFELVTIIAFIYFSRNNCDFVVLETGLGGIYDATNICYPLISVITSIGYDHMSLLGNTLKEIAVNKAGIIKNNSDTVFIMQEKEVNDVIIDTCSKKNNKLHLINCENIKNYTYNEEYQSFDYKEYKKICVNLKGKKQCNNAILCLECVQILNNKNYKVSDYSIKSALNSIVHKARFEKISEKPKIIFDGAHNIEAIKNFNNTVDMYYKNVKKIFIISILKSKDYDSVIKELMYNSSSNDIFIFTSGNDIKKYVSKEILYEIAKKYSNSSNIYAKELEEVVKYILDENNDYINFIVGSFYTYKTVIKML